MKRPSLASAVGFNRAVRQRDEWFDDPDDLDRVARALASISHVDEPVEGAAILASRLTAAQGFAEGNKRTALLLARWVLDHNGIDGSIVLPADDREIADLLVEAASGRDVEDDVIALFRARAP